MLPTAAAYEHPDRPVEAAARWFGELGATVRPLPRAHPRRTPLDEANARPVAEASLHLPGRRVADAPALGAQGHARCGTPSSPRGRAARCWPGLGPGRWSCATRWSTRAAGALTLGLGLIDQMAVIPHHDTWSEDKAKRTLHIAPDGPADRRDR